jgi:uncharacterized membrane protein
MSAAAPRLQAIDVVRGIIMIVMALDHTRDYFGIPGQNPTNLATASAALFATRWITHFCAPVFFLLLGTGAYLSLRRQSRRELSRYLLTRGLWLILLEVTVMRCLVYQFNFDYRVTMLLVLWALGWAMIALSVLLWLPLRVIAGIGLVMIFGHHLLEGVRESNVLWVVLHRPGFVWRTPESVVFAAYPLIPWLGVSAVGYVLGRIYEWDPARRRTLLLPLGLAACAAFIVLRAINVYGDPSRWTTQPSTLFTVLAFLNTSKYPPSLLFLLMTLGPAMLMLWVFDGDTPRWLAAARVFGRVPLCYFVLHFFLIHLLASVICVVRYGSAHWMLESPDLTHYPFSAPPGWGYELPGVYLLWVLVVAAMYPLCRWFAALKQRRTAAWLGYV